MSLCRPVRGYDGGGFQWMLSFVHAYETYALDSRMVRYG